jgi:hypothetical protein
MNQSDFLSNGFLKNTVMEMAKNTIKLFSDFSYLLFLFVDMIQEKRKGAALTVKQTIILCYD